MGAPAKGTIRLATASPATQATTRETLAQLQQIAARAVAAQADLLLLPEAYLGGYPRGSDFGCRVGARSDAGRDEFLHYFQAAVDLGDTVGNGAGAGDAWAKRQLPGLNQAEVTAGDDAAAAQDGDTKKAAAASTRQRRGDGTREELERIAREMGVFIVVGLVERAGGSLYCSVVYVSPSQGMIGKRRKVQPTGTERLIWAQGSPATLKAVTTTIRGVRINLAAAICWENYMPLLRQSLYQQNINLYLAPTADGRDAWLGLMRTIALEGRCFVVSSNMCVRSSSNSQNEQSGSSATANAAATPRVASPSQAHHGSTTKRRNSCLTEEGFEIALPRAASSSSSPSRARKERRRSIFDADGNEIVLPCEGKEKNASAAADVVAEEDEGVDVSVVDDGQKQKQQQQQQIGGTTTTTGKSTTAASADNFLSRGGSSIVSPMGDVIAGPQWEDDQGIIYADVDFEDCIRGRLDLDAAGSYSRNDSFKFSVEGIDLDPLPY
ncbi:carbon-nitrogen hydrolase [Apiospora phragmitis]|uniref:Carbon-nitrogen hydrolase n=1 Tax=Apiospora phragmitis TaxID=2905665 RepID=A0ABR1WU97_9PEZI